MLHTEQFFIPILTSEAGLCLTAENWKEVNVVTASYSLEKLLYKPGQITLKKIQDLAKYLICPGNIVLNASSLCANKEGVYILKSPFDGARINLSLEDLCHLIQHLKPDAVILPKKITQKYPQIWENWNDEIIPFIDVNDIKDQQIVHSHGVYFSDFCEMHWENLEQWSHLPRYVIGNIGLQLIKKLHQHGVRCIETDVPAQAAILGKVYSKSGEIDLTSLDTRMQFEIIDAECTCPTCTQNFTRAYLHHLLQHTPLLCQRFLIQHNIFYVQNAII